MLYPGFDSYEDAALKGSYRNSALKATTKSGSMFITGHVKKVAERDLLSIGADVLKSDVIIMLHHGSKTSSTSDFIEAVPLVLVYGPLAA